MSPSSVPAFPWLRSPPASPPRPHVITGGDRYSLGGGVCAHTHARVRSRARGGGRKRRRNGRADPSLSPSSPAISLWTAAGARRRGRCFLNHTPSSLGQWMTGRRAPEAFGPSTGDRGSVWGKESGRRAHRAGWCVRVSDLGRLGATRWNPYHAYVLKNVSLVPDSGSRSAGSVKGPDNQFRMSILERLEQMEKRMADMAAAGQVLPRSPDAPPIQDEGQGPGFEARVVVLVESMIPRSSWRGPERLAHGSPFRGMSLLHLAAAQGYARLIETLSQWRSVGTGSLDLEQEADPLNVDHFSCTPLMWACALGHLEAAVLLFRWNRQALSIPDSLGRLPLSVAHSRGHVRLARCLEELQRQEASTEPPVALSPPSSSPDTGLSSVSSPSELSEGTFSVTSAYSSAPDGSPLPASDSGPGQLSSGAPAAPLFLMDCEATNPHGPAPSPPPLPPAPEGGAAPEEADSPPAVDVIPVDMISLAKQIIEATPERIKREDFVGLPEAGAPMRERTGALGLSETMSWLASYLENVDHFPSSGPPSELPFERGRLAVPPAPSWAEFLSASASGKMESDFALLTLSDHEQRELYEAARVIQTAFRKYKGRRLKEQQEVAAAVIQRCYRKYKQFALYKKMTQAAILIQSKFRSYYEQKRFQQSRRAAVLIQQHYRSYRRRPGPPHRPTCSKGSFLTKKQDQAARKIMRFLRRCRHRMRELKQSQELEGLPQPGLAT